MIFTAPFSRYFWVCYLCSGLSDLLDGFAARKLNQESEFGAKLDSIADIILAIAITIVVATNITIPIWLLLCVLGIAVIRVGGYTIGFLKFQAFSALHTYSNKVTGFLIFIFPALYILIGFNIASLLLLTVALFSSVEELIITAKSKKLNRDCKGLFIK